MCLPRYKILQNLICIDPWRVSINFLIEDYGKKFWESNQLKFTDSRKDHLLISNFFNFLVWYSLSGNYLRYTAHRLKLFSKQPGSFWERHCCKSNEEPSVCKFVRSTHYVKGLQTKTAIQCNLLRRFLPTVKLMPRCDV